MFAAALLSKDINLVSCMMIAVVSIWLQQQAQMTMVMPGFCSVFWMKSADVGHLLRKILLKLQNKVLFMVSSELRISV